MLSSLIVNGNPLALDPPAACDAVVPWWSFGKTVLAAAALTLVRDGLVGLDDPMPEGPFTLRHVLRHEAGLADYGELAHYHAAVAKAEQPWPADEMLQRVDASRLRYEPGKGWRYSNIGYLYVARLIERMTGLSLEEALIQRALSPVGVSRVRLASAGEDLHKACLGITPGYDAGWVYHGLLIGPLAEATLFLDRLLSGSLLPRGLLQEMQAAIVLGGPIAGRPWLSPGYGLGLMQGGVAGGLTLSGHTGAGPDSVVAVYRGGHGEVTATCAVFHGGAGEDVVEAEAVRRIAAALGLIDGL